MLLLHKSDVTQKLLHEYLDYDPQTGHLTWAKKLSVKTVVGRRAGTQVKSRDNRIIKIFGLVFIEHRLIWLYVTGCYPSRKEHIDHINHCEADNSWDNLRLVTQKENNKNLSKRSDNTTGVVGVWVNRNKYKKYTAEIKDDLGTKHTQAFYTLEEAANQRKLWEAQFGYHLNHGIDKVLEASTTIPKGSTPQAIGGGNGRHLNP